MPDWCEVTSVDIVRLRPGETHLFHRAGAREKILVESGHCLIGGPAGTVEAAPGVVLDLDGGEKPFEVLEVFSDTTLVRFGGRWANHTGSCGPFTLDNADPPCNAGDPVHYPRRTRFDNHYHDCDEYWVIVEGRAIAVSEEQVVLLGPDDCLATPMGHHHDIPLVIESLRGVYCETTLRGALRPGHLWDHTHGPAVPHTVDQQLTTQRNMLHGSDTSEHG
jgi:mannose-6-phosphate isomerase-like protein (cupin superfamily)